RDDLPYVTLAGETRDEALDPHREAAVRRCPHRERLEQVAELRARLVVGHADRPEDALLHLHVMDPDRAGAELPPVPDEVVMVALHLGGMRLVPRLLPGDGCREGVVHEGPRAGLLVLLEERE